MKASFKTITLLLLLTMIFSCNETEIFNLPAKPAMSDSLMLRVGKLGLRFPKKKNGRLYFENMEDFKKYMLTLTKLEAGYLQEYNKAHDFISWFDIMEADDSTAYYMQGFENYLYVSDPWFASILNQQREVQINQWVFNYTNEIYYIYHDGHEDEINKFANEYNNGKIPFRPESFYRFSNYLTVYFNQKVDTSNDKFIARDDCYTDCTPASTYFFAPHLRFRGNTWRENFILYFSLGSRTIFQKRVWCTPCCGMFWPFAGIGWAQHNAYMLKLKWQNVVLKNGFCREPGECFNIPDGELIAYNSSIVAVTFAQGFPLSFSIGTNDDGGIDFSIDFKKIKDFCKKTAIYHAAQFKSWDPVKSTTKGCNWCN